MGRLSPARAAALEVTSRVRKRDAFVRDVLPVVLTKRNLSSSDKAFASLLSIGVVQTQGTLDLILNRAMNTPNDIKPDLRDALRISVYEMFYLGRDSYVAVDQGVELAARVAPRARGLANAVLRKASAVVDGLLIKNDEQDVESAALRFGFPDWLARNLAEWLGLSAACNFMEVSNEQPPVFVSINSLRASEVDIKSELLNAGVTFEVQDEILGCLKLLDAGDIGNKCVLEMIDAGKLIVSDAAAQMVAQKVAEFAGSSVLEIGAGRGTKTSLLQSDYNRMCGQQIERLVCVDNVEGKAALLSERAQTYGMNVSEVITADATNLKSAVKNELFSAVFIDSPCTGLGTLRRHPEIRWRLTQDSVSQAAILDLRLLIEASAHVASRGCLVYATCTVSPDENMNVVHSFLNSSQGTLFRLLEEDCFTTPLTSGGCDSHFCAVMVKND